MQFKLKFIDLGGGAFDYNNIYFLSLKGEKMKKVLGFKIPDFKLDFELFQGTLTNCQEHVLTDVNSKHGLLGSLDIFTSHKYYTTFDIGGATFRCDGKYPFRDSDKVVLYASPTDEGYYQVEALKNFTRKFFIKCTAMSWRKVYSSIVGAGGVPAIALNTTMDVSEELSGVSALVVGGWFYMSVLRKARKKAIMLNKEIENYPEF